MAQADNNPGDLVKTTRHRSFRSLLAGSLIAGSVALIAPAAPVLAADVDVTIVDEEGNPIGRAMVAVLDADGVALDGAIANDEGTVTVDDGDGAGAGYVASAPGFETLRGTGALTDGTEITLTAAGTSARSYSNAYGAQGSGVFADGEAGVFYITTDGIPSVWRTMDYAGTWSPVPTTAYSDDGLPQGSAGGLTTSGYPGEVAVVIQDAVWFSTDFGSTWDSLSFPQGSNISQPEVRWAHSETASASASVLLVASMATGQEWAAAGVYAADMTTSEPVLTAVGATVLPSVAMLDLVGAGGSVYLARASSGSNVDFGELTLGGGGWALGSTTAITGMQLSTAPDAFDSLEVLSLGKVVPDAAALFEHTISGPSATGVLTAGSFGSTWQVSSDLVGQQSNNDNPFNANWADRSDSFGTGAIDYCGVNNTATAISIAPVSGAESFAGFELIGTVGSCMWAYNAAGTSVAWPGVTTGSAPVATAEVGVAALDGINNNTGFAWSAGYDFDTDKVAIAPNEAGIAKSASIPGHRPQFSSRGARSRNDFVNDLAASGTGATSGGIAINGLTAAVVRDIAMDPNDATGETYALVTSPGGGSRVLLTTDGGESFSTVTGGGGESMAWWNGDGLEFMAAFAGLTGGLSVKPFTRDVGAGAAAMGDELAKTAADREADAVGFAFPAAGLTPAAPLNTVNSFLGGLASGNAVVSAMSGAAGTNYLLVGGSTIQSGGGSVDAVYSAGSVGLLEISVDASNAASVTSMKVFGENRSSTGDDPTASDTRGSYTDGGVTSITYCPVGSGAAVADKAFITVKGATGGGLFVLSGVSTGSPTHSEIAVSMPKIMSEVRVDCGTGLIVGVAPATMGSPPQPGGVYMSTDAATFIEMNVTVPPSTLDVEADEATGEITMVIAGGNGDVISIEMDEADLGIDLTDVKAGTEGTPDAAITPPVDAVTELNSSQDGINTGGVADIELPPGDDEVDLEEEVAAASVRRRGVKALATGTPVSIGSASGAFESTVGATSTSESFISVEPGRVVDTRLVGSMVSDVTRFKIAGATVLGDAARQGELIGVPVGADAVAINVTVTGTQAPGFVSVYPCAATSDTPPNVSNVNYVAGATVANSAVVPLSTDGYLCVKAVGATHALVDVAGYLGG